MMTNANPVHHHDTSNVGLFCTAVCAGGALEYIRRSRGIADSADAHRPPQRGERGVEGLRTAMKTYMSAAVLLVLLVEWSV